MQSKINTKHYYYQANSWHHDLKVASSLLDDAFATFPADPLQYNVHKVAVRTGNRRETTETCIETFDCNHDPESLHLHSIQNPLNFMDWGSISNMGLREWEVRRLLFRCPASERKSYPSVPKNTSQMPLHVWRVTGCTKCMHASNRIHHFSPFLSIH